MNRQFLIVLLLVVPAAGLADEEFFRHDSRRWERSAEATLHTDLAQVEPASAVITGKRQKGKWKAIPFATADFSGTALSIYHATNPEPVRLTLPERGPHAIYLGLATTSGGFGTGENGLKARLDDEPVFQRLANHLPLLANRRAVIEDCYLGAANLTGQSLEIAPLRDRPATLCYVRTVPLSEAEFAEARAPSKQRTAIATFDGHSWIWPFRPVTAAQLAEEFRGFEGSDFSRWWFQVTGADLVNYPSEFGTYPGEGTDDFPSDDYAGYTESLEALFAAGVNPLQVARDAAREQGAEFHVILRPGGWVGSMPYEETFNSRFYYAHPEWRCFDKDGTPTFYLSYSVPEVRAQILNILRETLACDPEGVGFTFHRGMPLMLWEEAFRDRFAAMHEGVDARTVDDDDPRIHATRADIMTGFLREIRALLDETAAARGKTEPYRISLGTFSTEEDNRRWGIDLENWIDLGLVDDIAVTWFAYHTSFTKTPGRIDLDYYRRITEGTDTEWRPMMIAWKTGKPQEFCAKAAGYLAAGADGIALWDPQVHKGWPDRAPGRALDVFARLGHRGDLERWAKEGVPRPLSIPLTRLDENYFSRWFPNTGF